MAPTRGSGSSNRSSSPGTTCGVGNWLLLTVVIVALFIGMGALLLGGFGLSNTKDLEKKDDTTQQQISSMLHAITVIQNQIKQLQNQSSNSTGLVTNAVFNQTITQINQAVSQINNTDIQLQEQIDNLQWGEDLINQRIDQLNSTGSNCTDCVRQPQLDAFEQQVQQMIAASSAILTSASYGTLSGDSLLATVSEANTTFFMQPYINCTEASQIVDYTNQRQSIDLWIENVIDAGICPNNSVPIVSNANNMVLVCPCYDGLYSVSFSVQGLNINRKNADGSVWLLISEGGDISIGLVYSPTDGYTVDFFNEGPWPLPPVASFTWDNPTQEGLIGGITQSTTVSFSGNFDLPLKANIDGDGPACYRLVMNLLDTFNEPESDTFCHSGADTAAILYSFSSSPPSYPDEPSTFPSTTFSIQRIGWQGSPPVM